MVTYFGELICRFISIALKYDSMIEPIEKNKLHNKLVTTGTALHSLFWGKKPQQVNIKSSDPNIKYSALEYLMILRYASDLFTGRVERMLKDETVPSTHDFDLDKFLAMEDIDDQSLKANIEEFMESRAKLLRLLNPLADEDWDKYKINHEKYGELTLRQLLTLLANYEEEWVNNIRTILKEHNM